MVHGGQDGTGEGLEARDHIVPLLPHQKAKRNEQSFAAHFIFCGLQPHLWHGTPTLMMGLPTSSNLM